MQQVPANPAKNRMDKTQSFYYTIITALFITAYLTANLMAVKIIAIGPLAIFDAGTIIFPLSYMLGDVLTEIWGYRAARRVVLLAIFCNLILVGFTALGLMLPVPTYGQTMSDAYGVIFGYVPRIVLASVIAFLAGELINAKLMVRIKAWTAGKHFWLRTIGSSIVGHFIDTTLFVTIAFAALSPWRDIVSMILIQYVVKLGIEALGGTPLAYAAVAWLRRRP